MNNRKKRKNICPVCRAKKRSGETICDDCWDRYARENRGELGDVYDFNNWVMLNTL